MSSELREFAAPKIEPCLSAAAKKPPSGPGWPHEIKHDGFRMMVRRDAAGLRIITRNGRDWTSRFPLMASAANAIKAKDFLIDGEAVSRDDSGLAVFERIRHRRHDASVFLYQPVVGAKLNRPAARFTAGRFSLARRHHPGLWT
jgi:ATP-dependent DNA ligase